MCRHGPLASICKLAKHSVPVYKACTDCMETHLRKTSSSPSVRALTRATGRASLMLNSPSMVSLAIFTMSTADLRTYPWILSHLDQLQVLHLACAFRCVVSDGTIRQHALPQSNVDPRVLQAMQLMHGMLLCTGCWVYCLLSNSSTNS